CQRVELVVMAAGATQRQPKKDLRRRADDVVELIEAIFGGIGRLVVPRAKAVVTRGNQGFGTGIGQLIPGELFEEEAVVRLVIIEGANDVIAVAPDVGFGGVALVAVAVGVANQVE